MNLRVHDFNFFYKHNKVRQKTELRLLALFTIGGVVLFVSVCALVVSYILSHKMKSIQHEIDSNVSFLENPATIRMLIKNEELNERLSEITAYNEKAELLHERVKDGGAANSLLIQSIASYIPTDTGITSLSVSSASLEIVGTSQRESSIAQFKHNMESLGFVDSAFVGVITKRDVQWEFTMSVKMKEVATVENIWSE